MDETAMNSDLSSPTLDQEELEGLLGRADREQSYSAYQNAGRALERLALRPQPKDRTMRKPIRIALVSSSTIEPFLPYLRVESYRQGFLPECFTASYERYHQELLDPQSRLVRFNPEIVFLDIEPSSLLPGAGVYGLRPGDVNAVLEKIDALITTFRSHVSALIVPHNFVNRDVRPYAIVKTAEQKAYEQLNADLWVRFQNDPNVVVLDADGLANYHGKMWSTDGKLRYLAGMNASESLLPLLARSYVTVIRALRGLKYKCLVLDLDNTLWGGVVGEVGCEGVVLGPALLGRMYMDFQRAILQLYEQGILLAISSKNNPADALDVIRKHPHMILREEYFASIQIGWDPKPEQVNRIARELNIGTDSLVFVDDDPVERAQMRHYLPEVRTVEVPEDASQFARMILTLTEFEQIAVTDEDLRRNEMYAEERKRDRFREKVGDFEDFLRGLKMVVEIRVDCLDDGKRAALLTQKTNQFNLTTRRYGIPEIQTMMAGRSARVFTLRVRDVFGDSGMVGVAIVKEQGRSRIIDTFLLSCRVIGKRIERILLDEILQDAKQAGMETVSGTYIRTAKNGLVENFYADAGFRLTDGPTQMWEFRLDDFVQHPRNWLEVTRHGV